jgi:hypothetical protein
MAKKKPAPTKVESIRHKDKRKNIPTEELRDFVADDDFNGGPADFAAAGKLSKLQTRGMHRMQSERGWQNVDAHQNPKLQALRRG